MIETIRKDKVGKKTRAPVTPLLDLIPKTLFSTIDTCKSVLIANLFTISRKWSQPRYLSRIMRMYKHNVIPFVGKEK